MCVWEGRIKVPLDYRRNELKGLKGARYVFSCDGEDGSLNYQNHYFLRLETIIIWNLSIVYISLEDYGVTADTDNETGNKDIIIYIYIYIYIYIKYESVHVRSIDGQTMLSYQTWYT